MASVDRLKLVNPPADELFKGEDGLMHVRDGVDAEADASVRLTTGVLETSNVNVVDTMVDMIGISRQYEMQVQMMKMASDNASASSSVMRMS